MTWHLSAACRGVDTAVFFDPNTYNKARATCDQCPVRQPCLDAALAEEHDANLNDITGIRGGTTPKQRKAILRQNRTRQGGIEPGPIRHGTITGHQQHVKRHVRMCDECRDAWNEYKRQYAARKREENAA